jgi:Glycine/serine hydroxymethyltransferase
MTENHLLLLDLQKKEVNGKEAEELLGTVIYNS